MLRHRSARPVTLLALAAALMLAMLTALPLSASAHDTLLTSDPDDGATVETSPEAITLTFSADVLDVSPLVVITDDSGTELAEITPTIEGPTATAELPEPLPAGTQTVQWRVVSSDGHPIEGTFTVTVEQDATAAEEASGDEGTAEASDAGGAAPAEDASPSAPSEGEDVAAAEAPATDESGISMPVLIGILAVVILGAGAAVVVILRKRG